MELSGADALIDADGINRWIERMRHRSVEIAGGGEGNSLIRRLIEAGKPAAIGKIGSSECWTLAWHLQLKRFYKYTWVPPSFGELDLAEQSGVFPNSPEMFHQFAEAYLDQLPHLDLCAVWFNPGEAQILGRLCPQTRRIALKALDPFFFSQPWSSALKGKKVVVIHPFEETIRRQYTRRNEIWTGSGTVLPDFELRTIRAPYGFSTNDFPNWLAMLRWLENELERCRDTEGFDVALIGCGAAGIPLAVRARELGGIGIHLGGSLQLLFGIRGKRWDVRPEYQPFFNDAWSRASAGETPKEAIKVDQGGYW
ncbi:MAG: hypothetical protein QOE70_6428 [Chthoniobacter sp.]|jgi:hypothetical protein|nr:hypothetical protein [Chthoniobacter sp.]